MSPWFTLRALYITSTPSPSKTPYNAMTISAIIRIRTNIPHPLIIKKYTKPKYDFKDFTSNCNISICSLINLNAVWYCFDKTSISFLHCADYSKFTPSCSFSTSSISFLHLESIPTVPFMQLDNDL